MRCKRCEACDSWTVRPLCLPAHICHCISFPRSFIFFHAFAATSQLLLPPSIGGYYWYTCKERRIIMLAASARSVRVCARLCRAATRTTTVSAMSSSSLEKKNAAERVLDDYKGQKYPFRVTENVRWGDMDALAHLNNVQYFVLFEQARCAYFKASGLSLEADSMTLGPILKSTSCDYKAPTKFPDTLTIGLLSRVTSDTEYEQLYAVVSHNSGRVIATGRGELVHFDYAKNERAPLPPELRDAFSMQ